MLKDELDMSFNYKPITYGQVRDGNGKKYDEDTKIYKLICEAKAGEKNLAEANKRLYGKEAFWQTKILYDNAVVPTIRAQTNDFISFETKQRMSEMDIILAQTFPTDYDFGTMNLSTVSYICGMSVPPRDDKKNRVKADRARSLRC